MYLFFMFMFICFYVVLWGKNSEDGLSSWGQKLYLQLLKSWFVGQWGSRVMLTVTVRLQEINHSLCKVPKSDISQHVCLVCVRPTRLILLVILLLLYLACFLYLLAQRHCIRASQSGWFDYQGNHNPPLFINDKNKTGHLKWSIIIDMKRHYQDRLFSCNSQTSLSQ